MTIQFNLPESFVATIGKDMEMTVDVSKVPVNVIWHYVQRELTDDLRDSHASVTRDSFSGDDAKWRAAKMAVAEKKLASLYAGTIRAAKATEPLDPVATEALRLARVFINAKAKDWQKDDATALSNIAGWAQALGMPNTNSEERKAVVAAAIAKRAMRDDVRKDATDNVERAKALREKIAAPVADAAADL